MSQKIKKLMDVRLLIDVGMAKNVCVRTAADHYLYTDLITPLGTKSI